MLVLAQRVPEPDTLANCDPIDISLTGLDSWSLARRLLDEEGVGVMPGAAFGDRT
jgi:aspartate/methionine/tyrosine aminotransferase